MKYLFLFLYGLQLRGCTPEMPRQFNSTRFDFYFDKNLSNVYAFRGI